MTNVSPWWLQCPLPSLSPLRASAVLKMQLDPPFHDGGRVRANGRRYAQLWWLQWYARPDLRERQLPIRVEPFAATVIHPETIAEWREPPQWSNAHMANHEEAYARSLALSVVPISDASLVASLHPSLWEGGEGAAALAFQASQSRLHGDRLAHSVQGAMEADPGAFPYLLSVYLSSDEAVFSERFWQAIRRAGQQGLIWNDVWFDTLRRRSIGENE